MGRSMIVWVYSTLAKASCVFQCSATDVVDDGDGNTDDATVTMPA